MSLNYEKPLNDEAKEMVEKLFGKPVAMDDQAALVNIKNGIDSKAMSNIANAAQQPVSLELNDIGDTKVVKGIPYKMTEEGWVVDLPLEGEGLMSAEVDTRPNEGMLENRIELLEEDIECVHIWLDDKGIVRNDGNRDYSIVGRIKLLFDTK